MDTELEDDYVREAIQSIKVELEIVRESSIPDPKHVEELLAFVRFGIRSGKFTYELLGTSPAELLWFSHILITH